MRELARVLEAELCAKTKTKMQMKETRRAQVKRGKKKR